MTPYLYAHENQLAPKRENGLRFWGYPGRSKAIRTVGVHTAESIFDLIGEDGGAESVARYQSNTPRPSSYHRIVDRDSTVTCLPDEATAFGIVGLNSGSLHVSFALRGVDWSDAAKAAMAGPMLARGAVVVRDWCKAYGIPPVWLTRDQAYSGECGLIRHGVADPERRTDPGVDFPTALFTHLVEMQVNGKPAPPVAVQKGPHMVIVKDPSSNKQWLVWMGKKWPIDTIPELAAYAAACPRVVLDAVAFGRLVEA